MTKNIKAAAAVLLALAACARAPEAEADPLAQSAPESAEQSPAAELARIADDYLDARLALDPLAAYFGLTDVMTPDHAGLTDNSPTGRSVFEAREDKLLADLRRIDPEALDAREDWIVWRKLNEAMEANVGLRVCRQDLWGLNHMGGWQSRLARIADEQPVSTGEERSAALARWSRLPRFIEQEQANLAAGLAEGYSAPKRIVARVIAQIDGLIAAPVAGHPFLAFAGKAADHPDFRALARQLYDSDILPALKAFRAFLADDYMPAARGDLSIAALPDGAACYEARLRSYHTAAIGGEATFRRGEETVAAHRRDVVARGEAMFGLTDFEAIIARAKAAPENRFESEEELIAYSRALVPQTRALIARQFNALLQQEMIVEPYPDYLKGTGQSSRYESKPAAEGPSIYRISTEGWEDETRGEAEITAVHEGWPGHHLQIATARGLEGLHPVTRLLGSTAYVEGWARYAEALAEEAGVYESGYGEILRRAWPARGMVVDPGLHIYGWSHEEAKALLIESGRFTAETAETMLDRIAVMPGQLTAYDTGGLEIMALRADAERRLGERFDLKAFHDRVLENGSLPLSALRDHVEAWIAESEKE